MPNYSRRRLLFALGAFPAFPAFAQDAPPRPLCKAPVQKLLDWQLLVSVRYSVDYKEVLGTVQLRTLPNASIEAGDLVQVWITMHVDENLKLRDHYVSVFLKNDPDIFGGVVLDYHQADLMIDGELLHQMFLTTNVVEGYKLVEKRMPREVAPRASELLQVRSDDPTAAKNLVNQIHAGKQLEFALNASEKGNPERSWHITGQVALDDAAELLNTAQTSMRNVWRDYQAETCQAVGLDCYLTTLCAGAIGLPDDCYELRTLRRFRDGWLVKQQGGEADVATYYATANQILARLNARADRAAVLRKIYLVYILPCLALIKIGANRMAWAHYRRLHRYMSGL